MPTESFYKFKDYDLWLTDGFLMPFELLLFEDLQAKYGETDQEINEFKDLIVENSLLRFITGDMLCINFDKALISGNTLQRLIKSTESIIEKIVDDQNLLTNVRINELLTKAKNYSIEKGKSKIEDYPEIFEAGYGYDLPIKNYLHAFYLIKLLLKGEIKDSDRNFLLVGD